MARIEVFSGPQCSYCTRAKALLERKGIPYTDLDIASDPRNLAELSRRLPRSRSIPQIFADGKHLGGFEDLQIVSAAGGLEVYVDGGPVADESEDQADHQLNRGERS